MGRKEEGRAKEDEGGMGMLAEGTVTRHLMRLCVTASCTDTCIMAEVSASEKMSRLQHGKELPTVLYLLEQGIARMAAKRYVSANCSSIRANTASPQGTQQLSDI